MKLFLGALIVAATALGATPDKFVLHDEFDHPFIWWPDTLLSYPVQFDQQPDLEHLVLAQTGAESAQLPIQFSNIVRTGGRITSATLNFISDLPTHGHKEFSLITGVPRPASSVTESKEGNTIVLGSGAVKVRIPATQDVTAAAPGPVQQLSRGGKWFGASTLVLAGERITHIESTRTESGPLFITYRLTYSTAGAGKYIATVRCIKGMDFVQLREDMEGLPANASGSWAVSWNELPVSFRQSVDHPYPFPNRIEKDHKYNDYPWEPIAQSQTNTHLGVLPGIANDGALPFSLGIYEPWSAFSVATFANFWDKASPDAIGVFIDKIKDWQDHDYAIWHASSKLQVRFYYKDNTLSWKYPLARGARSTCLTLYDHAKDVEAMQRIESYGHVTGHGGQTYSVPIAAVSHALFLQNRYGTIDLNDVKDWVLTNQGRATSYLKQGLIQSADELERRVMNSQLADEIAVTGTRQNAGFGPTVSRQIQDDWIDGFERLRPRMTEMQRTRITAMFLFLAYIHAGEDYMPMVPMLSGHPNFLADVKSVPASLTFLFPTHPLAQTWADEFEKFVELNTRYHTRPAVAEWETSAGRWTENLGTYVWAFLRPVLRADVLLKQTDGSNRIATPQMAEIGDWLVNALSAPFDGESPELLQTPGFERDMHEWGIVRPGQGPRRIYPPMGAHAERRIPPRALWYLGRALQQYAPLTAEHLMWAARPTDQEMETPRGKPDPFAVAFEQPDNRGTDPHLRSSKYTGFGITLRAGVSAKNEVSVHLQQIDDGPNYRWGNAGEGGNGVLYFYAGGKSYSYNGTEDVGDRVAQDTDFCTNFGVWKDSTFHSVGRNVLTKPLYDLGVAQFAELVPRTGYATPEYVSRSVLLAGSDYFVLYDDVFNESVGHRLSWYVRHGEEFPNIQTVRPRQVQLTELQTIQTNGRWYDGAGDSLAVVTGRKDIKSEATPFGARVHGDNIDDLVFRDPAGIHYNAQGIRFEGTAGIIRRNEIALFHGTRIGVPNLTIETSDTDLGISATIKGESVSGIYHATHTSAVNIQGKPGVFYVDGVRQSLDALPKGTHHWEITSGVPAPLPPAILRTENISGGTRVVLTPGASNYHLFTSKDNGQTWVAAGESTRPEFTLSGLTNDTKIHVRATAMNSEPGPEYPIYLTGKAPFPPEGLHLVLHNDSTEITWGEILGVTEYRLYARTSTGEWRVISHGLDRQFSDSTHATAYRVTALNGNGEGPPSRVATSDPASWRNFDPQPGEPFRRTSVGAHYYPN